MSDKKRLKSKVFGRIFIEAIFGVIFLWATCAVAEALSLETVAFKATEQEKVQLILKFSDTIASPKSFSTDDPAIISFDFLNVKNKVLPASLAQIGEIGVFQNINVLETKQKTRVAINLKNLVDFDVKTNNNQVIITLDARALSQKKTTKKVVSKNDQYEINSFDFHRGEAGEAKLVLNLSTSKALIDVKERDSQIFVTALGATINENLLKNYDVLDFATPVKSLEIKKDNNEVRFDLRTTVAYTKAVYQLDNQFVLEIKPKNLSEKSVASMSKGDYTGSRISLNFQDIEVRAILQIIADFSKFNIIASDNIKGNITLRLEDLPWDQALDIILKSKGLDKRVVGNVMMVGSVEEIASQEKATLDMQKQVQELGLLKSELIQINYAVVDDIATMLKDKNNSLLTSRGNVSADKRTNTLLVQDIEPKLQEIKDLLKKLDVPMRQVEIATQIVSANRSFEDTFGVKFGGGANAGIGHRRLGVGAGAERARAIANYENKDGRGVMPPSGAVGAEGSLADNTSLPKTLNTEGLFSDLGASQTKGGIGKVGLALARLPAGTLLDLELQAMEYESNTKTLTRPRLVTMDQVKATVEQGQQIPYTQSSSSGATSVAYQSATTKVDVTPHITPDDKIFLDLDISQDAVTETQPSGVTAGPAIDTTHMQTKVLVDNGETIMLGGILTVADTNNVARVPFFGNLPIIGGLFRNKYIKHAPKELVIFLTPRIINNIQDQG